MRRVLIVDDELNIRNILEFSLNAEGFDVIVAENGEAAIELARTEAPDLIILDVMMPGLSGIDTCARLKRESGTSQIPVILLTAKSHREDREAGLAVGADQYITKPFSPHTVIAAVSGLLGVVR